MKEYQGEFSHLNHPIGTRLLCKKSNYDVYSRGQIWTVVEWKGKRVLQDIHGNRAWGDQGVWEPVKLTTPLEDYL